MEAERVGTHAGRLQLISDANGGQPDLRLIFRGLPGVLGVGKPVTYCCPTYSLLGS